MYVVQLQIINTCKEALLPETEIIEKDGGVQVTTFEIGGQDGVYFVSVRTEQGEAVMKVMKN